MSKIKPSDRKIESEASPTPHFFSLEPADEPSEDSMSVLVAGVHLRSGDLCPQCHRELLDYDGLLNLTCPGCGFTPGGGCFS